MSEGMITLKYGNTNTFYLPGNPGGLLIDTDYAGTLPAFFKAIKKSGLRIKDIEYVLATHYHPDHMGIIGELMAQGVKLLLVDVQKDYVHFSDEIFEREQANFVPVDENRAAIVSCADSRAFLAQLAIAGEILHTPSHSLDSVTFVLDDGNCFAGDLEPFEYIEAYEDNAALRKDWKHICSFHPKCIFYAHRPEKRLDC